jgi:hypothetical protein
MIDIFILFSRKLTTNKENKFYMGQYKHEVYLKLDVYRIRVTCVHCTKTFKNTILKTKGYVFLLVNFVHN